MFTNASKGSNEGERISLTVGVLDDHPTEHVLRLKRKSIDVFGPTEKSET